MNEVEKLKKQKRVEIIQITPKTWKIIEGKKIAILPNYLVVVY
jgi:hypothetical protein